MFPRELDNVGTGLTLTEAMHNVWDIDNVETPRTPRTTTALLLALLLGLSTYVVFPNQFKGAVNIIKGAIPAFTEATADRNDLDTLNVELEILKDQVLEWVKIGSEINNIPIKRMRDEDVMNQIKGALPKSSNSVAALSMLTNRNNPFFDEQDIQEIRSNGRLSDDQNARIDAETIRTYQGLKVREQEVKNNYHKELVNFLVLNGIIDPEHADFLRDILTQ
ncbi:hypothetical protein IPJ91_01385 [bacterium]|nr:MAG: hypothetical protein IPJ91_01385 [bacterium]